MLVCTRVFLEHFTRSGKSEMKYKRCSGSVECGLLHTVFCLLPCTPNKCHSGDEVRMRMWSLVFSHMTTALRMIFFNLFDFTLL